jgi:hypothetical protein
MKSVLLQSHQEDIDDDSSLSSVEGDTHFQYACAAIGTAHPKIAMALTSHKARDLDLRSVWLLDNQSLLTYVATQILLRRSVSQSGQ